MLTRTGDKITLEKTITIEEYHEIKLALMVLSVDMAGEEWTKRGKEGLSKIINHFLPAMEVERDESISP